MARSKTENATVTAKEIAIMAARVAFYLVVVLLIMLLWEGRGLFIYENF